MLKLITDTCFWRDLHAGDILYLPFKLGFKFAMSNFCARELKKQIKQKFDRLVSKKLEIITLKRIQIQELSSIQNTSLSPADKSAYILAKSLNLILLTSEQPLRNFSETKRDTFSTLVCHPLILLL